MNRKGVVKIAVDVLMTLALFFLMGYSLWGEKAHWMMRFPRRRKKMLIPLRQAIFACMRRGEICPYSIRIFVSRAG